MAGGLISSEVLGRYVGEATPQPSSAWTLEPWPIGASLALLSLAAVFRHGTRLQRDTEGLV